MPVALENTNTCRERETDFHLERKEIFLASERPMVLVIDGNFDNREILQALLQRHHYNVKISEDGESAADIAIASPPDVAIVDMHVSPSGGLAVCRYFRAQPKTAQLPILLLTAPEDKDQGITALELGADDFVLKPFHPRELVARVDCLVRRNRRGKVGGRLEIGRLAIDPDQHEVTYGGSRVRLTAAEFRIMKFLAEKPGSVHSRQAIYASTGGDAGGMQDRAIDAHIKNIRRKLGDGENAIETVRGCGYRLRRDDP